MQGNEDDGKGIREDEANRETIAGGQRPAGAAVKTNSGRFSHFPAGRCPPATGECVCSAFRDSYVAVRCL